MFTELKDSYTSHHDTGIKFEGCKIEYFQNVIETAKRLHCIVLKFGVYNWDFAIDEKGHPVLIEVNTSEECIWMSQMAHERGVFGDKTPEVLSWLREMKKKRNLKEEILYLENEKYMKYTLVLLSGGVGSRMHQAIPKQYMLLAGKPVIMHILERIDEIDEIKETIIVCADEYVSHIALMSKQYGIKKSIRFAPAGATRQASVKSGLDVVETEDVIIHEAARPFVKVEDFETLINDDSENATFGIDIPFTVLKGNECVNGTLNRSELVNVQLPQKFKTKLLKNAHEMAIHDGKKFTEDASLLYEYYPDIKIRIIKGKEYNLKITTRMDLITGEQIYKEEMVRRV